MAKRKNLVKFFKGTSEQYDSITPDAYTFYFLTDVNKIYVGDIQLSNTQIKELWDNKIKVQDDNLMFISY